MEKEKYVSTRKAREILGVCVTTLHRWEREGKIETIRSVGKHRMYNVSKYVRENKNKINEEEQETINEKTKENIVYVRVSTLGQKDDLERQKKYMKQKYPKYRMIEDIGSGINFNRKGLRKIIKLAIEGKINKLVIAHKDRLTRFGYELIEDLIKEYSEGEIIIEDKKDKEKEPREEIVEDVLQILNVYTAKMNGLRKYEKNNNK
jgi:predicted site-specific integrase-resolvase